MLSEAETVEKEVIQWNNDVVLTNVLSIDDGETVSHEDKTFKFAEYTRVKINDYDENTVELYFEDGTFCFDVLKSDFD